MSLINSLLTELEARHAQNAPARPPPADLQHLQAVQPDEDATRRRRGLLLITALASTLAAAWVVFFPSIQWNWRFWEEAPPVEILREELATTPTVQLLSDTPATPDAHSLADSTNGPTPLPPEADPSAKIEIEPFIDESPRASVIPLPLVSTSPAVSVTDTAPKSSSEVAQRRRPTTPTKPKIPAAASTASPMEKAEKLADKAQRPAEPEQRPTQPARKDAATREVPDTKEQTPLNTTSAQTEIPPKPVTAAVPSPPQESSAQRAYQEGKLAIKKGFLADAERYLREALGAAPKHVGARGTLAGLYIEQGRWMEAEHILNEGLKLAPQELSFIRWQSRVLIEQGAEKQALQLMEEAPESALDDAEFCGFLATLYNRANNFEKAVPMYRKALGLKPTEGRWWVGLASVYERKQNYPAAIDAYARGVTDPRVETALASFAKERIANLRTRIDR